MSAAEELMALMRARRSIRRFRSDPVPGESLCKLIEAASWAPSAGNRQDWVFTVVTSPEVRRRMADAVRKRWQEIIAANRDRAGIEEVEAYSSGFADFADAPVVTVVSARRVNEAQRAMLGDDAHAVVGSAASAAMAAQNLMLAAHALSLGSCCMTGALAAREELSRIAGIGRRHEIVCLIALGYPAEAPCAPSRKDVAEIVRFVR